jgi:uncharacterized protein YdaL
MGLERGVLLDHRSTLRIRPSAASKIGAQRQELPVTGRGLPFLRVPVISSLNVPWRTRIRAVAGLVLAVIVLAGPAASGAASNLPGDTNTVLILHDSSGDFGWIGEVNATLLGNLLGHFPLAWYKAPVEDYHSGDIDRFRMVFYLGTTFDNPLPEAFLADVMTTSKVVCWMKYNLWRWDAGTRAGFESKFGFRFEFMDSSGFTNVQYKGETFSRHPADPELGRSTILNTNIATSSATVLRGWPPETLPYILHGSNFWYVADVPFSYMSEEDRYLVFADLLHDISGIDHPESHRALIRLEDVNPSYPPYLLHAAADYLQSQAVPFAVATVPVYSDPLGIYNGGEPECIDMSGALQFVDALKYMIGRGGQLVMHGYTHQYDSVINPFTAATGDDYEFFRVTYDAETNLVDYAPVPEDSRPWVLGRIRAGLREFEQARLTPVAWETPHYAASALDYGVFAESFPLTIQRVLYFDGAGHAAGQFFPYVIERDVYGQKIMPENLGNVDPEQWHQYPPRLPQDLIRAARKNLVVRDGWASAFFHPYLDLAYLREVIEGIKALGYSYVPLSDTVAPTVIEDPQSATVPLGDSVTFSVVASGTGPLHYAWRQNGSLLAGATNSSLSLSNIHPVHAGAYSVDVRNDFGLTTSIDATLTVTAPPLHIQIVTWIRLGFDALADVAYVVEYRNSFADPDWANLTTVTGVSGSVTVHDPAAAGRPMRLYRLRVE